MTRYIATAINTKIAPNRKLFIQFVCTTCQQYQKMEGMENPNVISLALKGII